MGNLGARPLAAVILGRGAAGVAAVMPTMASQRALPLTGRPSPRGSRQDRAERGGAALDSPHGRVAKWQTRRP